MHAATRRSNGKRSSESPASSTTRVGRTSTSCRVPHASSPGRRALRRRRRRDVVRARARQRPPPEREEPAMKLPRSLRRAAPSSSPKVPELRSAALRTVAAAGAAGLRARRNPRNAIHVAGSAGSGRAAVFPQGRARASWRSTCRRASPARCTHVSRRRCAASSTRTSPSRSRCSPTRRTRCYRRTRRRARCSSSFPTSPLSLRNGEPVVRAVAVGQFSGGTRVARPASRHGRRSSAAHHRARRDPDRQRPRRCVRRPAGARRRSVPPSPRAHRGAHRASLRRPVNLRYFAAIFGDNVFVDPSVFTHTATHRAAADRRCTAVGSARARHPARAAPRRKRALERPARDRIADMRRLRRHRVAMPLPCASGSPASRCCSRSTRGRGGRR